MPQAVVVGLKIVLTLGLIIWVLGQVRKPIGPLGKRVVRAMNLGHAAMTDWALQFVPIARDATILDIGCGAGRTIQRLTTLAPDGVVYGIDYSAASVAAARDTNAQSIELGRVKIEQGTVASLPYGDSTYDAVFAVETHYYWPNLDENMREVFRVVKPGGTFALVAETYRGGRFNALYAVTMRLIRAAYLTEAEHVNLLEQAGFTDVSARHVAGKSWICVTGRKLAFTAASPIGR